MFLLLACAADDQVRMAAAFAWRAGYLMGDLDQSGSGAVTQTDDCYSGCNYSSWDGTLTFDFDWAGDPTGACSCDYARCESSVWSARVTGTIEIYDSYLHGCQFGSDEPAAHLPRFTATMDMSGDYQLPWDATCGYGPAIGGASTLAGTVMIGSGDPVDVSTVSDQQFQGLTIELPDSSVTWDWTCGDV